MITIVTPCYNHGHFLDDMLKSVASTIKATEYEIIIVNDGSTDENTLQILSKLEDNGIKVLHQPNMGLATARNRAIKEAKGKYILPLDADNMLNDDFVDKCCAFLETNNKFEIVYTDSIHFNDDTSWYHKVGPFEIFKLINNNYIDACAVYRKSNWINWGGYDGEMPVMGHEDWDLWLNYYFKGASFYYYPIPGFYYRVANNSMNALLSGPNTEKTIQYLNLKYNSQILDHYRPLFDRYSKLNYLLNEYASTNKIKAALKLLFGKLK